MFTPGQRVVCITDKCCPCCGLNGGLIKGNLYTIRDCFKWAEEVVATLMELTPPHQHCGWVAEVYFRPITERKTDISIFKEILVDPKKDIDAPEEPKKRIRERVQITYGTSDGKIGHIEI